jgi:hypothetical protein
MGLLKIEDLGLKIGIIKPHRRDNPNIKILSFKQRIYPYPLGRR